MPPPPRRWSGNGFHLPSAYCDVKLEVKRASALLHLNDRLPTDFGASGQRSTALGNACHGAKPSRGLAFGHRPGSGGSPIAGFLPRKATDEVSGPWVEARSAWPSVREGHFRPTS